MDTWLPLKRLVQEEKGSAMVLTAIAMVVLLGFTALAVDGGNLWSRHTRLQNIADACALAAGMEMASSQGDINEAVNAAARCSQENGLTTHWTDDITTLDIGYGTGESGSMKLDLTYDNNSGDSQAEVNLLVNTDLWFARVLGFSAAPVRVRAKAATVNAPGAFGSLPIGLLDSDDEGNHINYVEGSSYSITLDPGDKKSGNAGFLDFPPWPSNNGEKEYYEEQANENGDNNPGKESFLHNRIKYGYPGPVYVNKQYDTEPGGNASIEDLFPIDHVILVPVISGYEFRNSHGKDKVTVLGFAALKNLQYVKIGNVHHITATFDRFILSGSISGSASAGNDYGVKAVRLVD